MKPMSQIHADQFDQLPDSIVLVILNKVADIRCLGRCCAVSKRFSALVPLVHDVYLKIDRVVTIDGEADHESLEYLSSRKPQTLFTHFMKLMLFALLRPYSRLMRNANGVNKPMLAQVAHRSPAQVLKNFTHVRNLRIELPAGDVGTEDGVLLKWRAEFGSTLQSCVVLGGTKVDHNLCQNPAAVDDDNDNGSIPDSFYTNGGLKLRVVWTISSLIAASTRHFLLRPIIQDHPTIKSVILTDADGQGTLSMGADQLREFRENPIATSAASNRTQVPASNLRLRYAPFLELPEGVGMQGATLVAIKPSEEESGRMSKYCGNRKETAAAEVICSGVFDGPLNSVVKALVKRRTYLLEMNGF